MCPGGRCGCTGSRARATIATNDRSTTPPCPATCGRSRGGFAKTHRHRWGGCFRRRRPRLPTHPGPPPRAPRDQGLQPRPPRPAHGTRGGNRCDRVYRRDVIRRLAASWISEGSGRRDRRRRRRPRGHRARTGTARSGAGSTTQCRSQKWQKQRPPVLVCGPSRTPSCA